MFPFMPMVVAGKLLVSSFDLYMTWRQRNNFKDSVKPSARISKLIPASKYHKAQAYGHAKGTYELVTGLIDMLLEALTTLFFVSPYFWRKAGAYAPASELGQTLVFITISSVISTLIELPQSIYSTFVLEARFGFNKTTVATFISDKLKGLFLSAVLGFPIISVLFYILRAVLAYEPLVVASALWGFSSCLIVLMLWLFPSVIAPMFNTFTPMSDGPVKKRVEQLASSLKFPLSGIYVVDGSRRSAHSNAYIFGFINKYICIYDTLLEQCADAAKSVDGMSNDNDDISTDENSSTANEGQQSGAMNEEHSHTNGTVTGDGHGSVKTNENGSDTVVAVVCHELGHWKNGHLGKGVVKALVHTFVVSLLYALTAGNPDLYESFGFSSAAQPVIIGLMLFNNVLTPLDALLTPWHNYVSRKFEYEADEFARKMEMAAPLGDALVRMTVDNLSNMNPDPLYSMWNYSHPTLLERLDALGVSPTMAKVVDSKTNGAVEMSDEDDASSSISSAAKKDQ